MQNDARKQIFGFDTNQSQRQAEHQERRDRGVFGCLIAAVLRDVNDREQKGDEQNRENRRMPGVKLLKPAKRRDIRKNYISRILERGE